MPRLKVYRKKKKGETVEQQLGAQAAFITKLRKADVAAGEKKKDSWISQLKKRVQRRLKNRHSPAGRKYLRSR